jgi:hypothetical protein
MLMLLKSHDYPERLSVAFERERGPQIVSNAPHSSGNPIQCPFSSVTEWRVAKVVN